MEISAEIMDITATVSAVPTVKVTGNTTEVVIFEEGGVETLTIIVWCVGGVLLITLLSLLGRIILAKKKQPFDHFDYLEHVPENVNSNLFRIRVDTHRPDITSSQTRDTVDLVPGSDTPVTDTPVLNRTTTERQNGTHTGNQPVRTENYQRIVHTSNQNGQRNLNTRQLTYGEYLNSSPQTTTTTTAQILRADDSGSRAAINGYIIRPPSYRDVTAPSNRIPSVIVARDQSLVLARDHRHVIASRRQMFSL